MIKIEWKTVIFILSITKNNNDFDMLELKPIYLTKLFSAANRDYNIIKERSYKDNIFKLSS